MLKFRALEVDLDSDTDKVSQAAAKQSIADLIAKKELQKHLDKPAKP